LLAGDSGEAEQAVAKGAGEIEEAGRGGEAEETGDAREEEDEKTWADTSASAAKS
jgi:hypothetical protein